MNTWTCTSCSGFNHQRRSTCALCGVDRDPSTFTPAMRGMKSCPCCGEWLNDVTFTIHRARREEAEHARKAAACQARVEGCGGWCRLAPGHDGDHLCDGDTDGPGSCPA